MPQAELTRPPTPPLPPPLIESKPVLLDLQRPPTPALPPPVIEFKPDEPVFVPPPPVVDDLSLVMPAPLSPPPHKTLAERRAIDLPPTVPLSSPFADRIPRRDPAPTADSMHESTDMEIDFGLKFELHSPSILEAGIINAVRRAKLAPLDLDAVYDWNRAAAPKSSSRTAALDLDEYIQSSDPLESSQRVRIVIQRSRSAAAIRVARLAVEYRTLEAEWRMHTELLEAQMRERGTPPPLLMPPPQPADTIATPGLSGLPPTPGDDGLGGGRASRRRGGDAVQTEAAYLEILQHLEDEAARDPNVRAKKTTAVVPDMLPPDQRIRYDDENDLVHDPLAFYDFAGVNEPIWTDAERATFVKRYLVYPKQFGRIAEGLPTKTPEQCVIFYYRTKKEVDYKGMLAKKTGLGKKKPNLLSSKRWLAARHYSPM